MRLCSIPQLSLCQKIEALRLLVRSDVSSRVVGRIFLSYMKSSDILLCVRLQLW